MRDLRAEMEVPEQAGEVSIEPAAGTNKNRIINVDQVDGNARVPKLFSFFKADDKKNLIQTNPMTQPLRDSPSEGEHTIMASQELLGARNFHGQSRVSFMDNHLGQSQPRKMNENPVIQSREEELYDSDISKRLHQDIEMGHLKNRNQGLNDHKTPLFNELVSNQHMEQDAEPITVEQQNINRMDSLSQQTFKLQG